jgi:hypothetical protein
MHIAQIAPLTEAMEGFSKAWQKPNYFNDRG